jgi:proteasome accessory factor A
MQPDPRRIFGVETEYGLVHSLGQLTAEQMARELFADLVAWGNSSNAFLANGGRLYLDVGSHPEYATAECSTLEQLIAQVGAGDQLVSKLADSAQSRLVEQALPGQIHVIKNNLDSAGHSFGCHENYLIRRSSDIAQLNRVLIPFLVARQLLAGAGCVKRSEHGAWYLVSQRSDQVWETVSSATTRARPMINTRDEVHADPALYRRLHVIVGDSSMCQATLRFKVGSLDLVLRTHEAGAALPQLDLADPVAALRQISHHPDGLVDLAGGGQITGASILDAYLAAVVDYLFKDGAPTPADAAVLDLWQRGVDALRSGDLTAIGGEVDWIIKRRLIDQYCQRHGVGLLDPMVARLDLAYHDLGPDGLFRKLVAAGQAVAVVDPERVADACLTAPATTRAHLRGRFITAVRAAARPYTVDWSTLRLGGQQGHLLTLLDPFATTSEQLDSLLASLPEVVE